MSRSDKIFYLTFRIRQSNTFNGVLSSIEAVGIMHVRCAACKAVGLQDLPLNHNSTRPIRPVAETVQSYHPASQLELEM